MIIWYLIKVFLTLLVALLIPIYWRHYGPTNFLWLSDIGLFLTLLAFWTDSRLIMSIAALETFLLEVVWNIDFFLILLFNLRTIGLADYMFDNFYPFKLRCLSLFHILMPLVWLYYLKFYGYDPAAFVYATGLLWLILLLSYLLSDPAKNINWVFLPQAKNIKIPQFAWLLLMALGVPLLAFFPTHVLFIYFFNGR